MSFAALVAVLFGVFTFAGGIIGLVKAKSKASVIAGSVSAALLLAAAYGIEEGVRGAYWLGMLVSSVLAGRFAGTWRKTSRVMPDLIMVVFGLISFLVLVRQMFAS
jgi:uncharacterized membrane protein (UPF0136 family)